MMRREELLTREAWLQEDAAVKHAIELYEHGDRLFHLNLLPSEVRRNSDAQLSLHSQPGKDSGENIEKVPDSLPFSFWYYSFFHSAEYLAFYVYLCKLNTANLACSAPTNSL